MTQEEKIQIGLTIARKQASLRANRLFLFSDLFSAANAAVWEAVERHTEGSGSWVSFVKRVIQARIVDEMRDLGKLRQKNSPRFISSHWLEWGKVTPISWDALHAQIHGYTPAPDPVAVQLRLLSLIVDGKSIEEAQAALDISLAHTYRHVTVIRNALGVPNSRQTASRIQEAYSKL